ncbi:MAG TPA: polysaccharide deacetylase family protein [Ilumatobacteraceae bacterium]|nr:polysaccharide deacetylase family protein [Ilumatobacteraceae bacterium]
MPPRVTLTIDNGPTPGVTERVHEVLQRHAAPAMFFAVGRNVVAPGGQRLVEQAVAAGHVVGSHTWSHTVTFGHARDEDVDSELDDGRRAVADAGGDGQLFRPYGAGGVIDDRLMSRHGAERLLTDGCTCVLWNSVPGDWLDPAGWVAAALADIGRQPWTVVVLHDVPDASLAGLDEFLVRCADAGVELTLDVPDECTPIRAGVATTSFEVLGVGPAPQTAR